MKIVYATLTAVFVILILQSFSNDNGKIFESLDSSIRRTDSIVCATKKHVQFLDSHHTDDMREIDSLQALVNVMQQKREVVSTKVMYEVVHDTIFIEK